MLQILGILTSIVSLVCYVLVVVKMFQNGKTGPGLFSTIGLLLCGLGALFAFIYGWTKAGEWKITNVMIAWSVAIVVSIGINIMVLPAAIEAARQQAIQQQNAGGFPAPGPNPAP